MKIRSIAAVAAVSTLSLASVAALPASPASAADPGPRNAGTTWITGQLQGGLIKGSYVDTFTDPQNPTVVNYTDYGLSIDVALAIDFVNPANPTADAISDALAAEINEYVIQDSQGVPINAGSLAKAAVLAQTVGDSATSYGGRNLIADLAGRVTDSGPSKGRAVNDGFDYASTIAQALAAQALETAMNGEADEALDYLLLQQCTAGYFSGTMPSNTGAADQTCNGNGGTASIDATALTVIALLDQIADPDVETAVDSAVAWLAAQQQPDGSVGAQQNANRTGLAGWTFGLLGEVTVDPALTARAEDAAVWLRRHQVADPAGSNKFDAALVGAVALDDAGYDNLVDGMQVHDETAEVRRATAQALPALKFAPAGGTVKVVVPKGFVRAGTTQKITVTGLAPGDSVSLAGVQQVFADDNGKVVSQVTYNRTSTTTYFVYGSKGKVGTGVIKWLGKQRLAVRFAKASLKKGARQVVTVSELAPGEKYVIRVAGKVVKSGKAGKQGQAQVGFVAAKVGTVKVSVVGQFAAIRTGSRSFTVTR